MKIIYTLILLVVSSFNLSLANCIQNPFQKSKLQKKMPENTRMRFSENGGMAPTWHRIEIVGDELLIEDKKMNDDKAKKWFVKITNDDKASVYKVFVENKFDLIENEERKEIVYDAESEGIYIRAGKVSKGISYGMNSPLSSINTSRYSAVKTALKNLEKKYNNDLKPIDDNFAVINFNPRKHNYIFKNAKRTKLNQTEIVIVEDLIEKAVNKYNEKQKDGQKIKDLNKYKRQYIPVINKEGETEVWANFFCREEQDWKRNVIVVEDGGNCYFNLYINLTKDSTYKFSINGDG